MSTNGIPRRGDQAWFNREDMARLFDCSSTSFDQYIRPHVQPDAIRKVGRETWFWGRRVIEAWAIRHVAGNDADPLLLGNTRDSPALEEYRRWRAEREKMEVLRQKGTLVPKAELIPHLTRMGQVVRGAGERIAAQFGNAPADILNEVLEDYENELSRLASNGETDNGTPTNDGAGSKEEVDRPDRPCPGASEKPHSAKRAPVSEGDVGGAPRRARGRSHSRKERDAGRGRRPPRSG